MQSKYAAVPLLQLPRSSVLVLRPLAFLYLPRYTHVPGTASGILSSSPLDPRSSVLVC